MLITTKKSIILLFILFINIALFGQDINNKWVLGVGLNAVDYYPTNEPGMGGLFNEISNANDHWNIYGPKLSATRFLKGKFSVDASFSLNKITKLGDLNTISLMYYALDGNLQYNLLESERKFKPFLLVGAGYNWVEGFNSSGTLNGGIGANYWFAENIGLNIQGLYKYNSPDYTLLSHFYYSLSVVFKLNARSKSGWSGNGRGCYN